MKQCPRCSAKNRDVAIFCEKCGLDLTIVASVEEDVSTALEDIFGKTDKNATLEGANTQQTPISQPFSQSTTAAKKQPTFILKELRSFLGAYIANPIQAVHSAISLNGVSLAITLAVTRLLAVGLAVYGLLRNICSGALSVVTSSLLRFGNSSDILTANLEASISKSLIYGALIGVIGMFLFFAMLLSFQKSKASELRFQTFSKPAQRTEFQQAHYCCLPFCVPSFRLNFVLFSWCWQCCLGSFMEFSPLISCVPRKNPVRSV